MSTVEQRIDGTDANGLFIPDVMLSCQLVPAAPETGELRLQAALIYDLINLTDESPYSFTACIESLGGNADVWRKRLNAVYAGRLTLPKMHRLPRGTQHGPSCR